MPGATGTHHRLLRLLKENQDGYLPGPEAAERLGISRTSVWKAVRKLRALGYDVEASAKLGYRLHTSPDSLAPEEIASSLRTRWLGRSYHHYSRTDSTNARALLLATEGADHGTVVVAEEQSAGRGRFDRQWLSLSNLGIYMSLVLRMPLPVERAPQMTLVTALGVARAVNSATGLSPVIKWPNDILLNGKKICGILTEMQADHDRVRFMVVGVGVNVNHRPADMDPDFRYPATSLAAETGATIDRKEFFLSLLEALEGEYQRYEREGFAGIRLDLIKHSGIMGKTVTARVGDGELCGTALDLTEAGALVIAEPGGKETTLWSAEVTRIG